MTPILTLILSLTLSLAPALARDVTFPPIAGVDSSTGRLQAQAPLSNVHVDDVDIVTGSAFSGLTTYAHLQYINCFVEKDGVEKYDIAILGAPFDTVSWEGCLLSCLAAPFFLDAAGLWLCFELLLSLLLLLWGHPKKEL